MERFEYLDLASSGSDCKGKWDGSQMRSGRSYKPGERSVAQRTVSPDTVTEIRKQFEGL